MKPRVCLLWIDGTFKEIHNFVLPSPNEVGFYRQTTSYNAFRERSNKQHHKWYYEDQKKYDMPKRAHLCEVEDAKWWIEEFKENPQSVFHHATIWDMYKAIGYDYKKRRFV